MLQTCVSLLKTMLTRLFRRCHTNDEYQKGNCTIFEGRQKLMWKSATSPPTTTNYCSISFVLIARVWCSHPCGTVACNTHAYQVSVPVSKNLMYFMSCLVIGNFAKGNPKFKGKFTLRIPRHGDGSYQLLVCRDCM